MSYVMTSKPIKRQEKIRAMLLARNVVTLGEFCAELKCSESTIRNDLKDLDARGLITRTFGGAVANENTQDNISMEARKGLHIEEKRRMAAFIANHILFAGCTVTLDTGTTTAEIAKAILSAKLPLNVITDSQAAAIVLGKSPNISLYLTGGRYQPQKDAYIDQTAEQLVLSMRSDLYFLTCNGVSAEDGFTISDVSEISIKRSMAQCAKRTICVVDSSKLGKASLKVIFAPTQIKTLITDWNANPAHLEALRAIGMDVIVVPRDPADEPARAVAPEGEPT
jgi:DeoR/GlpR family transcriptional regulator of sugar metabolism